MPIRSMTGFGVADRPWPERGIRVRVELRSVNSRFLELKLRQPFGVAVEHELRRGIEGRLGRGRVDLSIRTEGAGELAEDPLLAVGVERDRIAPVLAALATLADAAYQASFQVSHPTSLDLLRFLVSPGISKAGSTEALEVAPPFLGELVEEALGRLIGMREAEGQALAETLSGLFDLLGEQIRGAEQSLVGEPERIHDQLVERCNALLARVDAGAIDREQLAREVALLVVRGDVSEELARIASHLTQARAVLEAPAETGQGKTLDFLSQELLREVTTIGSKITSHAGSALVIEAKGTIERIREQVQNVE
ncbi:MAG: DUF1732 domain-containing protein [Enhygromyxa sp.]